MRVNLKKPTSTYLKYTVKLKSPRATKSKGMLGICMTEMSKMPSRQMASETLNRLPLSSSLWLIVGHSLF